MPHKNADERRAYAAKYREKNREKIKAYQKKYIALNPDARAESLKKYNEKPQKLESCAKYREKSRDLLRAAGRNYAKANRPQAAAQLAKYRAAKLKATPAWASSELIGKFYKEAKELSTMTGIVHHVDHIIPLVSAEVCGLHVEFNLQILTGAENQKKGNRQWNRSME